MREKLYPDYFFKKVADIPEGFFEENKVRFAILDIDNTLVPYTVARPTEGARAFLSRLDAEGIKYCFLSNNSHERVDIFNEDIGAARVAKGGKPLKKGIKKAMALLGAEPGEVMLIGDQLFTDVWCAKRVGAKSVLVLPIEDKETAFFKFKRMLERVVMKNYKGDNWVDRNNSNN